MAEKAVKILDLDAFRILEYLNKTRKYVDENELSKESKVECSFIKFIGKVDKMIKMGFIESRKPPQANVHYTITGDGVKLLNLYENLGKKLSAKP